MGQTPEEILILTVLAVGLGATALAGLFRILPGAQRFSSPMIAAAFLAAYYLAYGKVPSIPPVGAVNKVFYIALAGAIIGLAAEPLPRLRLALITVQPVLTAAYIGQARLAAAPWEVALAALGGLVAMLLLAGGAQPRRGERAFRCATALAVFCLGFAPIALLGASSSGMQLVLIFAAILAGVLVWSIRDDGFVLSPAALLGGAGGLLALVMTVSLITRKADPYALVLLCMVLALPLAADRIPASNLPQIRFARVVLFTLACVAVAAAAALLAVARYDQPLPI